MNLFNEILDFTDYKPLGLNYYGAKKLIAPQIFQLMHERHFKKHGKKAEYFLDCFGGGGSMSLAALQFGYKAIYNELRADLCLFFESLKREPLPFEWCDKKEFDEIKKIPRERRNLSEICKNLFFSWNFGGNSYAVVGKNGEIKRIFDFLRGEFSREGLSESDFKTARNLVKKGELNEARKFLETCFGGRSGDCGYFLGYFGMKNAQEVLNLQDLQVVNGSFKDYDLKPYKPHEIMIYADIPYQDDKSKASYKGVYDERFEIGEFCEWCEDLRGRGYGVFVSEYNAPSENFTELLSLKKWVFGGNNGVRYEKIFILKDSENERQAI